MYDPHWVYGTRTVPTVWTVLF